MKTDIAKYYQSKDVVRRMLEFIGVPEHLLGDEEASFSAPLADSPALRSLLDAASTEYVAAYGKRLLELMHKDHASMKNVEFGWALDNGLDVHRSVWDRKNVLGILDMEYFSKNFPAEAYLNPGRTFTLLEPVYRGILDVLESFGLPPLAVTTGQGYNFEMQVAKKSSVLADIAALGHIEKTLLQDYSQPTAQSGRPVPEGDARAFDAMGKLMEFLCHRIILLLEGKSLSLPLVIGDIVCGNERREAVSLDLSLYSHPVQTRSIRCPFSAYTKHKIATDILGYDVAASVGTLFCIPRRTPEGELILSEVLGLREKPDGSSLHAGRVTTRIPDLPGGIDCLLCEYRKSALYEFHREFDAVEQDDIPTWPDGYDRFALASVPPCVAQSLRCPNPLLLQPTNLRLTVAILMASGWHPKHIAGLIYSKYLRDFGWEVNFRRYNANRWANVWVRIYAGMISCGTDGLLDLNCTSQQEKGEAWKGTQFCPLPGCGFNLAEYRSDLRRRI